MERKRPCLAGFRGPGLLFAYFGGVQVEVSVEYVSVKFRIFKV